MDILENKIKVRFSQFSQFRKKIKRYFENIVNFLIPADPLYSMQPFTYTYSFFPMSIEEIMKDGLKFNISDGEKSCNDAAYVLQNLMFLASLRDDGKTTQEILKSSEFNITMYDLKRLEKIGIIGKEQTSINGTLKKVNEFYLKHVAICIMSEPAN